MGFTSEYHDLVSEALGSRSKGLDGEGTDEEIEITVTPMWLFMDTSTGHAFYQWICVDFC